MRGMESNSVDTIICDPPYGLKFMGKKWDYDIPSIEIWEECLRVAKPGATMLCFGGSRTYHRMACAIEDAGWVIKDCIMWLYSTGFPKALDIKKSMEKKGLEEAKQWSGWKSHGLKPSYEPIICAMKPNDKTYVDNALKHCVSGLNIDECRIAHNEKCKIIKAQKGGNKVYKQAGRRKDTLNLKPEGRFPANVILDEEAGKMLDEQSGNKCGAVAPVTGKEPSVSQKNAIYNDYSMVEGKAGPLRDGLAGASRFFYCAKSSKSEKNAGCENLEKGNIHSTVKPLKLMEYLCNLTKTPTGGVVLDCFAGSCTTACACINTGRDYIIIEQDKDYCEIGRARVKYYEKKNSQRNIFEEIK